MFMRFCFWLCFFLITKFMPIFSSSLWEFLAELLEGFLLVFFYTIFVHKEIFSITWKRYTLRWIMGFAFIEYIRQLFTDSGTIELFRESPSTTITVIYIILYVLITLLLVGISYLLEYYMLTWGNALAIKFLSRSKEKIT